MRVDDIKSVKPAKDYVVSRNIELDKDNELFFAKAKHTDTKNSELSFGEIIAVGPTAGLAENCPEIKPGDKVVYNRYAGSHIATKEKDQIYKIMSGYNVMAKLDDLSKIDVDTAHPVSNRLLLAVKLIDETENGVFIPATEASDPRLEDLDYGLVVKVGPSCKLGYKVGDIVAFNPYAGENIRAAESVTKPALRVLIEEDVLLTI